MQRLYVLVWPAGTDTEDLSRQLLRTGRLKHQHGIRKRWLCLLLRVGVLCGQATMGCFRHTRTPFYHIRDLLAGGVERLQGVLVHGQNTRYDGIWSACGGVSMPGRHE